MENSNIQGEAMKGKSRMMTVIGFLAPLALSLTPTLGADDWYVFVFNNVSKELVRVSGLDGAMAAERLLPFPTFAL